MKKQVYLGLAAITFLGLAGCGTTSVEETSSTGTTATTTSGAFAPSSSGSVSSGAAGLIAHRNSDPVLQELRANIAPKFQTLTYQDENTSGGLTYHLFIPENYDPAQKYPLVLFMPDASLTGKEPADVLRQGYGSLIFASEEAQKKHPSFVVVPAFAGPQATVNDAWEISDEAKLVPEVLAKISSEYSVDTKKIYTTGQSGGGMLSFYFNLQYPELFAASMFVSSQWNPDEIAQFADKKFFYITSAADSKASVGMAQMKAAFDSNGTTYAETEFSAQLPMSEKEAKIRELLEANNTHNLVRFTTGTVMPAGVDRAAAEHMYGFDEAYKLLTAMDWLFLQSK